MIVNTEAKFMDPIFKSLEALKHERSSLAQRLAERQSQRQVLEQKLEQETLAIAQKKMDQCIVSSSRLQEEIDSKKVTKKSVKEACELDKTSMVDYMNEFQSTLAQIADDLFKARDSHREATLKSEILETEKTQQETKSIIEQNEKRFQALNRSIESLSIEDTLTPRTSDSSVEKMLNYMIRAIDVDKSDSEARLLRLQTELKEEAQGSSAKDC